MQYNFNDIHISFTQEISYELAGKPYQLMVDGADATDGRIRVKVCTNPTPAYEHNLEPDTLGNTERCAEPTCGGDDTPLHLQLSVENISGEPLTLHSLDYVRIEGPADFTIEGSTFSDWLIYRQGRHKNDIPSVFSPKEADGRFYDALGGMSEVGDLLSADEAECVVHSDSLTVFHYGETNVLFGFLTGRECFVDCEMDCSRKARPVIRCGCRTKGLVLAPGRSFAGEELCIVAGQDENALIRAYAAEKARRYQARVQAQAPAVYCTWYYYGLTVSYADVKENLAQIVKRGIPFDVFQIDEGWEVTLGEWEPNEKFPKSMAEIAGEIRAAGMRPGIWTSPFVAHETASIWHGHDDWALRDRKGEYILFPMNGTVYRVLDITNPGTYEYFRNLYHKLTFEWGYTYHKLDFTRAGIIYEDAAYYDPSITLVQAYVRAVRAIREGMGEEAYFLMCGGLYDPLIGLVDAQRMGADVLSMWRSTINKNGKALPVTVKQNLLRYYMNAWWNNDPDALMIRRQSEMTRDLRLTLGLFDEDEVRTAVVNQYIGGGLMCSTEPLATMDEDRLLHLRHILPVMEREVTVRGIFSRKGIPDTVDVRLPAVGWNNLILINWSDENERPASFVLTDALVSGIEAGKQYLVCEFYSGQYTIASYGDEISMGRIAPHSCAVFKVQEYDPTKPFIVGSTAHYSMGAEVERLAWEDGELILEAEPVPDGEDTYRVLLPEEQGVVEVMSRR